MFMVKKKLFGKRKHLEMLTAKEYFFDLKLSRV